MKQVSIGNLVFSKVICGANPFYGHSHFSEARDAEYSGRFDDEMIERTIQRCISLGINAVESSANERIMSILSGTLRSEVCACPPLRSGSDALHSPRSLGVGCCWLARTD